MYTNGYDESKKAQNLYHPCPGGSYSTKLYTGKLRLEALLPFHITFWQSLPLGLRAWWNGWMVKQWPQNVYNKWKLNFPIFPLAPAPGGNGWSYNHDRVLPRILWEDMNTNGWSAEDVSWFGKNFPEIPDFFPFLKSEPFNLNPSAKSYGKGHSREAIF